MHRSNDRYGRLVLGILFGKTTQRIAPVVAAVALFSTVVFTYNQVFLPMSQGISVYSAYPELQLPLTPFELTAPVLGLLLVFPNSNPNPNPSHNRNSSPNPNPNPNRNRNPNPNLNPSPNQVFRTDTAYGRFDEGAQPREI